MRTATSASDGGYVLSNLAIGPYRLEVSKSSFSTYVQTGIVLQVNTNPTIDVALTLGTVNQTVQVEANATQVEAGESPASAQGSRASVFWTCRSTAVRRPI